MIRAQSQLFDPRLVQPLYFKSLPSLQFRSTQSLHPGFIGSNGWFSLTSFEPNSMFAILMLSAILAGTGTFHRVVTRLTDLMMRTTASIQGADKTYAGYHHAPRETHAPTQEQHPVRDEREYEFLPPRERVIDYVHENGGRMYQQEIVLALDRSASTVSRYLSELEAEGRIKRLRDRRQNIVMLTDGDYDWTWELSDSPPGSDRG